MLINCLREVYVIVNSRVFPLPLSIDIKVKGQKDVALRNSPR